MSRQSSRRSGRFRGFPALPWLVAGAVLLGFWSLLLGQVERSVFARVPILDEVYYLDRAAEVVADPFVRSNPYFMSPLYPVLVAAAGGGIGVPESRVFEGPELRGLRILQIGFWCGTLALIRLMAGYLVPPDWRGRRRLVALWLPVILYALYRPAAVYAMAVLLETSLVFFTALAVYLTIRLWGGSRPGIWALALGLVLGLAVLLRGTVLLLVPVILVGMARRSRSLPTIKAMLLLILGVGVAVAPAVVHNSRQAGRLVGPTLNGGVNLYIGNGPSANGFYVASIPGDWRQDPAGRAFLAERLGRPQVSLAEADRIWADEAWHAMTGAPGRVLALMGKKVWLQLQGWEIDQLTPLAGWTREAPLLRLLVTPYALLVILGLAAMAGWRDNRLVGLLGVILLVLLLGQSLFFVVSRYRLVLAVLLAALAGVGAVRLWERRRAAWLIAVIAVLATVPWGLGSVRTSWVAFAQANEALRWADLGEAEASPAARQRAESLYRKSLMVEPSRPASWLGLATVLGGMGREDEQVATLRDGLKVVSDPVPLQKALLARELARNGLAEALVLADDILQSEPRDADTLHNMSVLQARTGAPEQALETARRLRRFHPTDPRGHLDVGVLLARSGQSQAAREAFREGLRLCPDDPSLMRNLSLLDR